MPQFFSSLLALLFFVSGPALKGNAEIGHFTLAAETAAPRVFFVTPRGVAVSSETLAGQGSSHLAGNFQGLAGATVEDVIARVPTEWTWGPRRSGQGIVFSDTAGFERIRMSPVGSKGTTPGRKWSLLVIQNPPPGVLV
jgi:hypothetical protein